MCCLCCGFSQDTLWPWVWTVGTHLSGLAQGGGGQQPLDAGGGGARQPRAPSARTRASTSPSPSWRKLRHGLLPLTHWPCCSQRPPPPTPCAPDLCMSSFSWKPRRLVSPDNNLKHVWSWKKQAWVAALDWSPCHLPPPSPNLFMCCWSVHEEFQMKPKMTGFTW